MNEKTTSWGKVSAWYDELLGDEDTYQKKVILPNLLRILDIKKGDSILDVGCGQGLFSREMAMLGAEVKGIDISKELIAIAKARNNKNIFYTVGSASDPLPFEENYFDKAIIILAIQNIADAGKVFEGVKKVLKKDGSLIMVLNHPAFRIPKGSDWGFDEEKKSQFRKIYEYMSEKKVSILMNPGKKQSAKTFSFHRPLQMYFKLLSRNGFAITRLEEWISHKESEKGPRKFAEDKARKEIPIFMMLEARLR